jgi:hypothetical protein
VRLLLFQSLPNDTQIIVKADRECLMTHSSECGDYVILGLPGLDLSSLILRWFEEPVPLAPKRAPGVLFNLKAYRNPIVS